MKNPDRRDVTYVEELIGPNTVSTMPRATLEAFLDHGRVADTLTRDVEDARRVHDSAQRWHRLADRGQGGF